jgi:hypothetical protein
MYLNGEVCKELACIFDCAEGSCGRIITSNARVPNLSVDPAQPSVEGVEEELHLRNASENARSWIGAAGLSYSYLNAVFAQSNATAGCSPVAWVQRFDGT